MRPQGAIKLLPRFIAVWAIAFTALVGVASGITQLFPSVAAPAASAAAILLSSIMVAALYSWRHLVPQPLPLSELLPESLDTEPALSLECTSERAALLEVHRLTEEVFPGVEPLPSERYEQWLLLNPEIFVCLFNRSRCVLAYFDIFPLRSDFMRLLIEGRVGEQDIRREHVLRPKEARCTADLYLGGVAVRDWHLQVGRRHAAMIVWGLLRYLDHHYPAQPVRTLYAHAVTPEGERLLQRFHFQRVADPEGRKDPYPLYAATLTKESRELIHQNLPDFSNLVRIGWAVRRPRPLVLSMFVA